jgi:hypothetical protein
MGSRILEQSGPFWLRPEICRYFVVENKTQSNGNGQQLFE